MALVPGDKLTFGDLARQWGFARWTVRERAKRLGVDVAAFLVPPQNRPAVDQQGNLGTPATSQREPEREPYPPGHPVSWLAISDNPWPPAPL